jgi:hypothetical protein
MCGTDEGRKFGEWVWDEVIAQVMVNADPRTKAFRPFSGSDPAGFDIDCSHFGEILRKWKF